MRLLHTFFFVLSFSLSGWSQMGQTVMILGKVAEPTGESAAFATVTLHNMSDSMLVKAGYTDENGQFEFPGVPAGDYFIIMSYVGYENSSTTNFNFDGLDSKILEPIVLQQSAQTIEEVVVTAKKPMIEVRPDKTVFNVEGSINAQGDDALGLLRKSPGVVVDNNDNIMLMGKNGVQVYIDGKPSPLGAEDLANFLRDVQSSDIESIEIMTNPPAKYEAEGNAGIINIKLKKNKNYGANATLNSGLQLSDLTTYNTSVNLNYRNNKTNFFSNVGYTNSQNRSFIEFTREINDFRFDQETTFRRNARNLNIKAGLDYFANDKSTFGILLTSFITEAENNSDSEGLLFFSSESGIADQKLIALNNGDRDRDNYNVNLNYQFSGDNDRSLTLDLDYGLYLNKSASDQPNEYQDLDGNVISKSEFIQDTDTDIDIYSVKADYEQPFLKGTLGFGSKLSYVKTDNLLDFYTVDESGAQTLDKDRSNQFVYDEVVSAGYLTYSHKWDKWNVQGGLRLENTHSKGDLISENQNEVNERNYLSAFPNVGITYELNPKNSLRISYSRRVDRPNYQDLNPFEFRLNELSGLKGNPNLQPQFTNSVQLSYTHNYSFNVSLNYSKTTDLITRLTDTLSESTSILTYENLASQTVYSLNVSYPYSPTEWWSIYSNVTGARTENKSENDGERFVGDKIVDVTANTVNFFSQNTFKLPSDISMELSGFYASPGIWGGNFETQEYWSVDFGISKKLFDGKGNLKLGVSDIFKGQEWEAVNRFGALSFDGNGGHNSRKFKVNFSYKFGNKSVKSARKRKTGLDDERKRTQDSGGGVG